MRMGAVGLVFLAAVALRAEGWAFDCHAGLLAPGCGLKSEFHGEDWGVEAGLAAIRSLGPRAEGRLEADFGGLAGHSPGPRSQVNVERLALMASFRYHPRGGRPFVAVALGTSRFRSRLSEREPDTPPVADRWPIPFQEDGAPWIPRPGGSPRPTPASVPGADTGFRPTWGIGLGQCFGRHLEGEIRWVGLVHGGRTLGAWQVRVGIRF